MRAVTDELHLLMIKQTLWPYSLDPRHYSLTVTSVKTTVMILHDARKGGGGGRVQKNKTWGGGGGGVR